MSALSLRRLWLWVQLVIVRVNPLTWAACASLMVAALGWSVLVPGWQDRVMQGRLAVIKARDALRVAPVDAPIEVPLSVQNLKRFTDALGDPRHMEQQLRTIFAIAQSLELQITQAEYKFQCDRASNTCAYRLQIPVKGSYGVIRRFSEQVLRAITYASLDDMGFKRDSILDDAVEAKLRFSLYVTPPPGGMPDVAGDEP